MFVKFENDYLQNLYEGKPLKGKPKYSNSVVTNFIDKVNIIISVENSTKLHQYKSLHFEELKGNRKGTYSIRIDRSYRLEFRIDKDKINLLELVIIDDLTNHYQ